MPKAYEGNEPYIFISYAHKDQDEVLRYVDALQSRGFRIWFDGGIQAGTEWPENIARHLRKCACVISFVSESFVESDNCRRELTFSQDLKIDQLSIFIQNLQPQDLPDGIRLQLGLNQAMFRENFDTATAFIEELCSARMLASCRDVTVQNELQEKEFVLSSQTRAGEEHIEEDKTYITLLERKYSKRATGLGWIGVILEILCVPVNGYCLETMSLLQVNGFWMFVNMLFPHLAIFLFIWVAFTFLRVGIQRSGVDKKILKGAQAAIWAISCVCSIITIFAGAGKLYIDAGYFVRLLASFGLYLIPSGVPFLGYLFLDE